MSELPQGWTEVTVADVIESFQAGFASGEKDVDDGLPHLRMQNIGVDGELDLSLLRRVPRSLASSRHFLKHGDVLVCTTNSGKLVGKTALFALEDCFAFSNHLTRLRPLSGVVDSRYLHRILQSLWLQGVYEGISKHWVNQSSVPKEELLALRIPLPPRQEQVRIVEQLEQVLTRVDACRAQLERVPALLKRFRQSVLAAACSGRLTEDWREGFDEDDQGIPSTWQRVRLGDLLVSLSYGTAVRCSYDPIGVPVLRIPNVCDGRITQDNLKYGELSESERMKLALVPGDLLMVRSNGSVSLIGRTAIVTQAEQGYAYAGYLVRLRIRHDILNPTYLHLTLSSYDIRDQIEIPARSTSGVNNINSTEIKRLSMLLPPIEEQHEIVRRITALFALADRLEARYMQAKQHIDRLPQSILAKAFRGELVPQDPNDEPAAVLLARIQRERGDKHGSPRRRSK